jgi:hypothetical protein
MSVVSEQEIAEYVDGVRKALGDLPRKQRDELLEDLQQHLAEVGAEGEGSLTDQLGPPEAYAAELRSAARLRPSGPTGRTYDDRIIAAWKRAGVQARALDSRLGPPIGYASASEFVRLLRPAWWVLRGYLVAMLLAVVTTGGDVGLLPRLGGSTLAALLLLAVCVPLSIWWGRREAGLTEWRRYVNQVATATLVIFALVGIFTVGARFGGTEQSYEPVYSNPYESVQDVYVYDEQGNLLTDVRLFDQNGQPIRLGYPHWCDGPDVFYQEAAGQLPAYPYCVQQAPFRVGPRPGVTATAEPTPEPTATPTATPQPTPSPTASAVPSPTA